MSEIFEEDDYTELNAKFFKALRESKDIIADPSGWTDTYSNVGNVYPQFNKPIQEYHTDLYNQLNPKKKVLLELASEWDACDYSFENITLCHSTTVGSVIVLAHLVTKGIKTIIAETPNYFATYYQAETMGIQTVRMPTYYDENFGLKIDYDQIRKYSPFAMWLTQPRTALGTNQNPEEVKSIIEKMSPEDILVVDEATEQYFPTVLASINPQQFPNVIKLRSFFKGLGVNGIRLSYIIHHHSLRHSISAEMEIFLGALDISSINYAVEMAGDIQKFKLMLSIANEQVMTLRSKADKLLMRTNCEVSPIQNGYIGCAIIKFDPGTSHEQNRLAFVEYCAENKVPVILGSAMGFPRHQNMEFIRLNYFNRDYNIINGLKIIAGFKSQVR
jgi:histidinol-phosphate/aromatic aminotransferase/cobyric acid decarboxylase-like protein